MGAGRELRDKVEHWLAWQRVEREVAEGILGAEYDRADRAEVRAKRKEAEDAALDEVWGSYRFAVFADSGREGGIGSIDLGAGHSSANETLCGRVVAALKSEGLLNEGIGAGYLDRHWPPALEEAGAWPLTSLRQSFLDGSLTRLVDPEKVLQRKVVEFVESGAFGLASGTREEGGYERLWYAEPVGRDEVAFERDVFLLTRAKAEQLRAAPPGGAPQAEGGPDPETTHEPAPETETGPPPDPEAGSHKRTATLRMKGAVPSEVRNRLGTKVIPRLRVGDGLRVGVDFHVSLPARQAEALESELRQVLADLELTDAVRMERS